MITVFLVEDEPSVREGLKMWLEVAPDILVVGEAASGEQALTIIPELQPDVVVMDLHLPGKDGITIIEQLLQRKDQPAVVVLSLRDTMALQARAFRAGARAFVSKHEPNERLLETIRRVAAS